MTAILSVRISGATRTITRGSVKVAGIVRPLRTIKVQDGGSLRTVAIFADPLTVEANDVGGTIAQASPGTVTTFSSTATPTGGQSPFTYAWTLISSSGGDTPTITTSTAATTTFKKTNVASGGLFSAVFRVTVIDFYGTTATYDISATFVNLGSLS